MRLSSTLASLLLGLGIILATPTPAEAFLGFGKKAPREAPSGNEKQRQDQEAAALVRQAMAYEAKADTGKAIKVYEKVVRSYPLTAAAAESQFQVGELRLIRGDYDDAFEAFQGFIGNYPQSRLFRDAIERQFEIAEAAKTGKQRSFLGIKSRVPTSRVIEMYETVIANAPFSAYAPKAQFSLAEVYDGQKKAPLAVASYQKVVDGYPSTTEAREAQFRIGQVNNASSLKSEDAGSIRAAQEAMQAFVIENPSDNKTQDAKAILTDLQKREANRAYKVAEFYDQKGNAQAASIYYKEVMAFPGSSEYDRAKNRLAAILQQDRNALEKGRDAFTSSPPPSAPAPTPKVADAPEEKKSGFRLPFFGKKDRSESAAPKRQLTPMHVGKKNPPAQKSTPIEIEQPSPRPTTKPAAAPTVVKTPAPPTAPVAAAPLRSGHAGPPPPAELARALEKPKPRITAEESAPRPIAEKGSPKTAATQTPAVTKPAAATGQPSVPPLVLPPPPTDAPPLPPTPQ